VGAGGGGWRRRRQAHGTAWRPAPGARCSGPGVAGEGPLRGAWELTRPTIVVWQAALKSRAPLADTWYAEPARARTGRSERESILVEAAGPKRGKGRWAGEVRGCRSWARNGPGASRRGQGGGVERRRVVKQNGKSRMQDVTPFKEGLDPRVGQRKLGPGEKVARGLLLPQRGIGSPPALIHKPARRDTTILDPSPRARRGGGRRSRAGIRLHCTTWAQPPSRDGIKEVVQHIGNALRVVISGTAFRPRSPAAPAPAPASPARTLPQPGA